MNKYIRTFRNVGATNAFSAVNPIDHGMRNFIILKKLVGRGVVIQVNEQQYYLDEEKEATFKKRRRIILSIVFLIIVAAIIFGVVSF
jgi:hypothetical protein